MPGFVKHINHFAFNIDLVIYNCCVRFRVYLMRERNYQLCVCVPVCAEYGVNVDLRFTSNDCGILCGAMFSEYVI